LYIAGWEMQRQDHLRKIRKWRLLIVYAAMPCRVRGTVATVREFRNHQSILTFLTARRDTLAGTSAARAHPCAMCFRWRDDPAGC